MPRSGRKTLSDEADRSVSRKATLTARPTSSVPGRHHGHKRHTPSWQRNLRLRGVPAQAHASPLPLTLGLQAYVLVRGPFRLEDGEALSLGDAVLGCKLQHEAGGLEG